MDIKSPNQVSNILYIFLGSFLTFFSTWLVQLWKNKIERDEKVQNFKLLIKQEFSSISKSLEKLRNVLQYKSYYEYATLDSLDKYILNLESYKKDAIYLSNQVQQEKFIDLISDISSFIKDARALQGIYDTELNKLNDKKKNNKIKNLFKDVEALTTYYNQQKTELSINFVDIKRRIEDFVKELELTK